MFLKAHRNPGFTLIELLIAVAIVAILTVIAYPSYQEHIRKGYRAAAQEHLMEIAQREQQYFIDNRTFAWDVATLNLETPPDVSIRYTIEIDPVPGLPPGYTVKATAKGSQLADGNLSINSAGTKTPADKW
jgi:type IV pilus assembly protein PilE